MNYGEFMAYHRQKPLAKLYLLAGEEAYFIDKAKKRIFELLFPNGIDQEAITELSGDISVQDLKMNVFSVPFFFERNIFLIRDYFIFNKKNSEKGKNPQEDELCKLLESIPEFSTLIFINRKSADRRRKIFKAISKNGLTLEAEPLKNYQTADVGDWLHGKLQELHKEIDNDAYQYFINAVSMMQTISLGFLEQEINKLAIYMGKEKKRIDRKMLVKALSNIPEISGFAMNDAISSRNVKKALYLFNRQISDGVYPPVILGMLTSHVRKLWQAKCYLAKGMRGKALAEAMDVKSLFIADRIARESKNFSVEKLKKAFYDLADTDYALKTGRGGTVEIEAIIMDLCT